MPRFCLKQKGKNKNEMKVEMGRDRNYQILVNHRLFVVSLNPVSNPLFLNHFPFFQQAITKLRTDFKVAIALSVSLRREKKSNRQM